MALASGNFNSIVATRRDYLLLLSGPFFYLTFPFNIKLFLSAVSLNVPARLLKKRLAYGQQKELLQVMKVILLMVAKQMGIMQIVELDMLLHKCKKYFFNKKYFLIYRYSSERHGARV